MAADRSLHHCALRERIAKDVEWYEAIEGELHEDHQTVVQTLRECDDAVVLLAELRDYTARLERASGAWFATRSYAVRPDAGDLRERLDALLGSWDDGGNV